MALNILVIDDRSTNRDSAIQEIKETLGDEGVVSVFPIGKGGLSEGMHEVRLIKDLKGLEDSVSLIVADRDLSAFPEYGGLSESTVQRVADIMGIPECGYARGERATVDEFVREGRYREACIRLDRDDAFSEKVVAIAKGFDLIERALLTAQVGPMEKTALAKNLANILEMPHLADKIALYASGDQSRLNSLIRVEKVENSENIRRLACFLGYWLWDSVLRFPGIVLDSVAASSYLNIDKDEFIAKSELRDLFADALYQGPFAQAKPTLWWRSTLDSIIGAGGKEDGRSYAAASLNIEVAQSKCYEERERKAGYYCFLKQEPVSYENSKPGLTWFPRGADLTRIGKTVYDQQVPWL